MNSINTGTITPSKISVCMGEAKIAATTITVVIKKYKTFSVLIYSYINTSGNWKNEKLCGNTAPAGPAECFHTISSFSNFHEC